MSIVTEILSYLPPLLGACAAVADTAARVAALAWLVRVLRRRGGDGA